MVASEFLKNFKERGFFYQCTDEVQLDAYLSNKATKSAYIGFDCTAATLHVGSLVQLMILRLLQTSGIKPYVLLGGATTKIGDPSGKDETRLLQTPADIERNKQGIKKVIAKFVTFDNSPTGAVLVDNNDWFAGMGYIDFLRDVGRHFSVNRMLSFESVKRRLDREQNLSFLEFNYMLLQAYDFVKLNELYGCSLQIGGSDQWGNIVSGVELGRRLGAKSDLVGLTTPLIATSSGAKMGKSSQGAIWLTAEDLSSYDYWQFWRNTEDKDVGRFLRLFTTLPISKIEELEKLEGAGINDAKIILANEATAICHGTEAAQKAELTARDTFIKGGVGDDLPDIVITRKELQQGIAFYKLLVQLTLAESGGEAKRLIKGGGARINDVKCDDPEQLVTDLDLTDEGWIKLSASKKKHGLVKVSN